MIPYSKLSRHCKQQQGSILVICMVLAALGTIGVAAWFSLIDARSHQVETGINALERRVAAKNSRAIASLALYTAYLHGNAGLAADTVYAAPAGKGRATIRAFAEVPLKSNVAGLPSNGGATPPKSNTTDITVDLFDGLGETRWTFRARNYNPSLAGDLLSFHPAISPTDTNPLVSGNLRVKGRAVFWDAIVRDLSSGIKADEFLLPDDILGAATFSNTADLAILPLNSPHYRRTTGLTSGGPAYRGELELMSAAINPQNAYEARVPNLATVKKVSGETKKSEKNGAKTKETSDPDGDNALIEMIDSSSPYEVANNLSQYDSLSSPVLIAAVQKSNPPLKNRDLLKVFDAQTDIPEDALTDMMGAIDETDYDIIFDYALIAMNDKNGVYYNAPGNGKVQIFLDRIDMNFAVLKDVTRLRLFGQPNATRAAAAAEMTPLLILVDNSASKILNQIELFHGNNRPVILVMASAPSSPAMPSVVFKGNSAFPSWRIIFDLQNTGLAFDGSGVAGTRIVGGIRTNHRITVANGTVTLERDTKPGPFANLLSRDAWIEAHRN